MTIAVMRTTAAKRLPRYAGAALVVFVAVAGLAVAGPARAASGAKVSILDSGFKPAVVRIEQWQVVTWTNDGKARHGLVSDAGSTLESGALDPGQAYAHVFKTAGTFAYHDPVHPKLTGRVVVVAAAKPTVTGSEPPSGTKPKNFKVRPGITSASGMTGSSGGTNWGVIGAGLGGVAVVLAAATLVARRRRG